MRPLRRIAAVVFAGDARIWKAAAVAAVPLLALIAFYCLRPRDYYTGTDSVEAYTYIAETSAGEPMCVPGLEIPAGTGRIRLQLISRTRTRPALHMALELTGPAEQTIDGTLAPVTVPSNRISAAVFEIPRLGSHPAERSATLCVTAGGLVNWGGTPLPAVPSPAPPTAGGHPLTGRIAVWYEPPAGSQRSYASRLGAILDRASLFRPSPVGPWLYVLILFVALPGLALASVRCLALALAGGGGSARRTAAWLFAIAALNFACWALITPPFQAPDEVDHFAYTQSLVQRGEAPSRNPGSPLARWSGAETLALEGMDFFSDHQVGDTRVPWTSRQQDEYREQVAAKHPQLLRRRRQRDGRDAWRDLLRGAGARVPARLQLAVLPADVDAPDLGADRCVDGRVRVPARARARARPALAMGARGAARGVSADVRVHLRRGQQRRGSQRRAAALELLLIMMLRRGVTLRLGLLAGALLVGLPVVKGTAYSLYPVAGIVLLATLWRHHRRADIPGWTALVATALALRESSARFAHVFHPAAVGTSTPLEVGAPVGAVSEALAHPLGYLGYLWQVFLPRLPFMARHWETTNFPGFVIFVERGWGAFGWYDVLYPHRFYYVILAAMIAVPILGLIAIRREWPFVRRHLLELAILALMPLAVVAGVEAAFYTTGTRPAVAEFGRYAFPAIAPLAVLVVASLHAFGRRWMVYVGAGLLVAMIALSYSSQLLTLTGFYA